MQRYGFTLLELIFTIAISAILSIGTFKALEILYIRSAKAKAVSKMSMQSQIVLDQLSILLYNRIPNSVIGYDGNNSSSCTPISNIINEDNNLSVLEWLASDDEQQIAGKYSGFVDMAASSSPYLKALGVKKGDLNTTKRDLVFAGVFDLGIEDFFACNDAYGWHGNDSNLSYDINNSSLYDENITLASPPQVIYEKYYITNGAYAVTRGEHVKDITNCNGISSEDEFLDFNNTLFLFYDFYPYNNETYCGDGGAGKVAVLAQNVAGFRATYENDIIRLGIDMNKTIRGSTAVHISKQKAVF